MTGKTLGESGADLDRMFLISSDIAKAIRGDNRCLLRGAAWWPEDSQELAEMMSWNLFPRRTATGGTGAGGTVHPTRPAGRGRKKTPSAYGWKTSQSMDAAGLLDRLGEMTVRC